MIKTILFALALCLTVHAFAGEVFKIHPLTAANSASLHGGTAFMLRVSEKAKVIVTAGHVCEINKKASDYFMTKDDHGYFARKLVNSTVTDICLLIPNNFAYEEFAGLPMAKEDPAPGSSITVYGYPSLGPLKMTTGDVLEYLLFKLRGAPTEKTKVGFSSDAEIKPGSSGSPALNSNGEVVGVVSACKVNSKEECIESYLIPISSVIRVLKTEIK